MADAELVKKMLREVLQANPAGVSLSRLTAQYKALTQEHIPHRLLGHDQLEGLLASMPSVVRTERPRGGETAYFAAASGETKVAKVVARQRSSKRTGPAHLVNTQMRVKPAVPLILNAKPQTSLRQPEHRGRGGGRGRGAGHGDFRHARDVRDSQSEGKPGLHPNKPPNQNSPSKKPTTPTEKLDRRMTLPSRFQKELNAHLSRNPQPPSRLNLDLICVSSAPSSPNEGGRLKAGGTQQVQAHLKEILAKYSNGFWASKLPHTYKELYQQELPAGVLQDLEAWTHICTVERPCSSNRSELLLYPAKEPITPTPPPSSSSSSSPPSSPPSSPATPLRRRLEELLQKYPSGLWTHALPKLFKDTYKTKLPGHILENLELLSTFCTIDYPMPDNPKRAILYRRSSGGGGGGGGRRSRLSGQASPPPPPPLLIPREEYPSVLVVEASNTNTVLLRYIGEGYSLAQESMEDEMRECYGSSSSSCSAPAVGQLAAVLAEEEEEVLRAQVCEVMGDKVKVFYVDHGFSEVISKTKVFELHKKFSKLPFQATKCQLAGLEPFSQEPLVLKTFEAMAGGKILLAEILERGPVPLIVLYDTSQDDDVNINAACLKALRDKTLASPLQGNKVYTNVVVSSVCSDGTLYCQPPSRGLTLLTETLERTEAYLHSQVTSDFLVSRPFCGKRCLARYKGKWSRVEITNLHGSRVLDLLFVDLGVQASVEVFELREIPPQFLRDLTTIPPQAVRCRLAELDLGLGAWSPEAVQWLRERALSSPSCSIKVAKVDGAKRCVHVHLFTDKSSTDNEHSLNRQMLQSQLFRQQPDAYLTSHSNVKAPSPPASSTTKGSVEATNGSPGPPAQPPLRRTLSGLGSRGRGGDGGGGGGGGMSPLGTGSPTPLQLPPLLELPPVGSNMDAYVSVACHPGHFVLQPWGELYKLVALMGEMILHYNQTEDPPMQVEKHHIYAAKVENNWHRVLVKSVLTNGLVSVYELDYGRHELVGRALLRTLTPEFRRLPFQGVTAQLAGVRPRQWSEEASIVFRNHVEKRPLVAQLESVTEAACAWDRRLSVYLVDTSREESDVWVHDIMTEVAEDLASAKMET
uniref:Tudor domain-containing protein 7B n=1 Tax=Gadus morhua TaxID=8049 RepID=A0A8C5FCC8_GADMO